MGKDFTTDEEITKYLNMVSGRVLIKIQARVLDTLQSNIELYTYSNNNTWYKRTNEFRDAFEWKELTNRANKWTSELFYHWQEMSHEEGEGSEKGEYWGVHNDRITNYNISEFLAEWLNVDGERGFKQRKPYWDITIEELQANIFKWFDKEFAPYGISR